MLLTRWLYLRMLGLTALIAVGSFWHQLNGLIGRDGISPAVEMLGHARDSHLGFFDLPTLLWLWPSDAMLHLLAGVAVLASLALMVGLAPRLSLAVLWGSWLSLVTVGGPFLSFQWDVLLVEAAALSIPFAPAGWLPRRPSGEPEPSGWSRWLLAFLAFKLTFSSGVVKLASGDPSWRDLTALSYHYWTQPLPTWTSVIAAQSPDALNRVLCAVMFVFELPLAACALGPRVLRRVSGAGMIALQVGLALAGNYAYYNLLAFALALPLLDDGLIPVRWRAAIERRFGGETPASSTSSPRSKWLGCAVVAFVVLVSVAGFVSRGALGALGNAIQPFATINRYGAFAVMTKTRPEIIVEGSNDGTNWVPYGFVYKPGALDVRPKWVSPFQPRLDWQMWFAALRRCGGDRWFLDFEKRLLEGSPEVLKLMARNPFPDRPPRLIRSQLYQYRFAPWSAPGQWWTRTLQGDYCPTLMLDGQGELQRVDLPH